MSAMGGGGRAALQNGASEFWQALVVAAVSAGKDAHAAMALADEIVRAHDNK
jgi:hypothetical protein